MEQEHMEDDSVKLLRECNAGIKMAQPPSRMYWNMFKVADCPGF